MFNFMLATQTSYRPVVQTLYFDSKGLKFLQNVFVLIFLDNIGSVLCGIEPGRIKAIFSEIEFS